MKVLKVILDNETREPLAIALVEEKIHVVYVGGDLRFSKAMKVSADKRKIAKFIANNPNMTNTFYNPANGTYTVL